MLRQQELFKNLIRYLDAADLRILSAFKSYVYLRHKSNAAGKMSPIARAKDHAATVAQAEAAAARNSGHGMSHHGRGGGGGGGTGIFQRMQSPGKVPHLGGVGRQGIRDRAGAAGQGADVLSEVTVPVSLINLVVHADQRRAPLRMFHFADALPALPPPPPPPPAHNTPSPRLMRPRVKMRGGGGGGAGGVAGGGGGAPGGGRDSGEVGQLLPTTREGVAAFSATGAGGDGIGAPGQPHDGGHAEGDDQDSVTPAVRRCATCETLPVVRIDDGEGEGADSAVNGSGNCEGGGHGGTESGSRGRGGSVHEGDISANEQVRGTTPIVKQFFSLPTYEVCAPSFKVDVTRVRHMPRALEFACAFLAFGCLRFPVQLADALFVLLLTVLLCSCWADSPRTRL